MPQTISQQYQAEQEEQRRRLRLQIANDAGYDPERATRVFHVSSVTNLPSEVVDADLEGLEAQLERKEFSFDNYTDEKTGSPVFNEFAAEDPYNFAVLDRDRKNMSWLEKTWTINGQALDQGWAMGSMTNIIDRRLAGDEREGDEKRLKELRSLVGAGNLGAEGHTQRLLEGFMEQAAIFTWIGKESADEAMLGGMAGALTGGIAAGGLTGGLAAPAGAAAGWTAGIGAGFWAGRTEASFRMQRALAYDEYIELGIDEVDARMAANVVGAVTAPMESLGLGALTKRMPGFRNFQKNLTDRYIKDIFVKPTVTAAMGRMALQYGEGVATEVLTEVMQEATQMSMGEFLKRHARDAGDMRPQMDPMSSEDFRKALGEVIEETIYATALMAGGGPVTDLYVDSKRAAASKRQQQMWADLGEAATDSTTRTEAPTAWNEFVKRVQEKGPLKDVWIDGEGFRKYWQSKEIDPKDAAAELGIDLEESEVLDTDLKIPFATYVDKVAPTEHHNGLMPSLRLREGEMTFAESEEYFRTQQEKIDEVTAALEEQGAAPDQEIIEDLTGQLVAMEYTPKAAKIQAEFTAAVLTTTAIREGRKPMDLYRERFGGLQKEVPSALQQQSVDMKIDPLLDRIRNQDFPTQRQIYGESLFDIIRQGGGIQDQGGELSARDVHAQFPGMVAKEGLSIDAAAELAFDKGFIPEHDEAQFMEAFDRELGGEQVFGRDSKVNAEIEELLGQMEAAAEFLNQEGIDLDKMTNEQVREYLKGVKTLEQSGDQDLKDWTDLVMVVANRQTEVMRGERGRSGDKDKMDSLLGRVEASRPRLADEQDFKDVTFSDKVTLPNGRTGTRKISAQKQYDRAVKNRNLLKRLLDCVNG